MEITERQRYDAFCRCYDAFCRYFATHAMVCAECFENAKVPLVNLEPVFMHPDCASNYRELRRQFIAENGITL